MKKILTLLLAAALLAVPAADAKNKKSDILNALGNVVSGNKSGDSSEGGLADAIGGFINNIAQNKNFSIDDLAGKWEYTGPSVTFESDNALMKIGGAGAATAVEGKLEPYYKRLGMTKSTLTVDADHNFTLKMGLMLLKGKIEKYDDDTIHFKFNAFGKVTLGSAQVNITKAGDKINLTFEATKMVQILTARASKVNSSSVSALADLLNSYDGIYMGFKMQKTAE